MGLKIIGIFSRSKPRWISEILVNTISYLLCFPLLWLLTCTVVAASAGAAESDGYGPPPLTSTAKAAPRGMIFAIVNSTIEVKDLSRERIIDLLTGRVTSLVNGGRVTLILAQSEAGEKAVYHLTERDTARLLRGWKRLVFGGSGRSLPLLCASDEEALNLLRRTPDGLLLLSQVDETELPVGLHVVALP
jgi:hypothetical protein